MRRCACLSASREGGTPCRVDIKEKVQEVIRGVQPSQPFFRGRKRLGYVVRLVDCAIQFVNQTLQLRGRKRIKHCSPFLCFPDAPHVLYDERTARPHGAWSCYTCPLISRHVPVQFRRSCASIPARYSWPQAMSCTIGYGPIPLPGTGVYRRKSPCPRRRLIAFSRPLSRKKAMAIRRGRDSHHESEIITHSPCGIRRAPHGSTRHFRSLLPLSAP